PEQGGTEELLGVHTGTGSPDFLTRRCGGPAWRPADRVETTRTPAHFGYQGNVHPCHGVPGRWTGRRDPPSSAVDVRGEGGHVAQVAVALRVVQTVAHDELVGDVEAGPPGVDLDLGGVRLAQQGEDLDGRRRAGLEVGPDPGEGQAGVDDVLDDEHVLVGDVGVEVLEDAHHTRGLGAGAVGADRHPVHRRRPGQVAHEVGHDHDRA